MAMTFEEFVERTGAEVAAGNIIVGVMGTRKVVGSIADGTFNLNDAGQEMLAELEATPEEKATRRSKKAEAPAADAPAAE